MLQVLDLDAELRSMVASTLDPVLTETEITTLLYNYRLSTTFSEWVASTAYAVGDTVIPTVRNGLYFTVKTAGTSDATEPTWLASGDITDGTVTWEATDVAPGYDLNRAAAQGWRLKAGKVANRYTMKDGVQTLNRSDFIKHCLMMAKEYSRKTVSSAQFSGGYSDSYYDPVIGNLNAG